MSSYIIPTTGTGQPDPFPLWFHERKTAIGTDLATLQAALQAAAEHPAAGLPQHEWQGVAQHARWTEQGLAQAGISGDAHTMVAAIATYAEQMCHTATATASAEEIHAQLEWVSHTQELLHGLHLGREQDAGGYGELPNIIERGRTCWYLNQEEITNQLGHRYGGLAGIEHAQMDHQPLAAALGWDPSEVNRRLYAVVSYLDQLHEHLTEPTDVQRNPDVFNSLLGTVQWLREQVVAAETAPAREFLDSAFLDAIAGAYMELHSLARTLVVTPAAHH